MSLDVPQTACPMNDVRRNLSACFGPHGRNKVVQNLSGGAVVVTKDGQQLLECQQSSTTSIFENSLLKLCSNVSSRCGDGSLRTMFIMSDVLRSIIESTRTLKIRIQWLAALETVAHTVQAMKYHVTQQMLANSVWWTSTNYSISSDILGLWSNVMLPGCNSAMTCNLVQLLVRILKPLPCHHTTFYNCCNRLSSPLIAATMAATASWDRHYRG